MKYLIMSVLMSSVIIASDSQEVPSFSFFDTNKNGEISPKEFNTAKEKLSLNQEYSQQTNTYFFHKIDADSDGLIQPEELTRYTILQQSNSSVPDNQCAS